MIHQLIVMRHAKSSWETGAGDRQRPLNARGCRDAARIGHRLVQLGWQPRWVLSSDSTRTRQTYEIMVDTWAETPITDFRRDFYHGSIDDIQDAVSFLPDEARPVMVLGHNPGWEDAVSWLVGERLVMVTAGTALLQLEARNWQEAVNARSAWELVDFLRPKELDEPE